MEKTIFKNRSTGQSGLEVFSLVDGDRIGDVVFEAGQYTLPDIVQIVNKRSRTLSARGGAAGDIRLKRVIDRFLATKHLTTEPPSGGNRHERRKAAALARRRA